MFNVLALTELAGPTTARQLSGSMFRHTQESEQSNLLVPLFQTFVVADDIPECGERLSERVDCYLKRGTGRPISSAEKGGWIGPSPINSIAGCPSDAVIFLVRRAGHLIGRAA
jgi:hypothetical protein